MFPLCFSLSCEKYRNYLRINSLKRVFKTIFHVDFLLLKLVRQIQIHIPNDVTVWPDDKEGRGTSGGDMPVTKVVDRG